MLIFDRAVDLSRLLSTGLTEVAVGSRLGISARTARSPPFADFMARGTGGRPAAPLG
jgi:hypothetical protein